MKYTTAYKGPTLVEKQERKSAQSSRSTCSELFPFLSQSTEGALAFKHPAGCLADLQDDQINVTIHRTKFASIGTLNAFKWTIDTSLKISILDNLDNLCEHMETAKMVEGRHYLPCNSSCQ